MSFTGSTEVGRKLMAQASETLLRLSMELGGNAPFIVFDDADIDAAVTGAMLAKMRNMGEACTSANRFHVAGAVAEQFAAKLAEKMGALKLGRGVDDDTDVGPLIDDTQRGKVAELVQDAIGRGATAVVGGQARDGVRLLLQPDRPHRHPRRRRAAAARRSSARWRRSRAFADEDEAVAAANDTEYGLVAYVFTSDLKRALRVCEKLETGMIGLNQGIVSNAQAPFGGVKQSGFGREGGYEGIEEYLETKYVAVNL